MTILQHWMNGRSIEWIARKTGKTIEQVKQAIRSEWKWLD